jgi:hypothetical protein
VLPLQDPGLLLFLMVLLPLAAHGESTPLDADLDVLGVDTGYLDMDDEAVFLIGQIHGRVPDLILRGRFQGYRAIAGSEVLV